MSLMRQQHVTLVSHTIKRFSRRLFGNLLHTNARAASDVWEAKLLPQPRRDEVSRRPTGERRLRHLEEKGNPTLTRFQRAGKGHRDARRLLLGYGAA
jgi:hypothetical protein